MTANALGRAELDELRLGILRRISAVVQSCGVSEHEVSCALSGDRGDLDVVIRVPVEASMASSAIAVRALDAVHADGRTFGHVDVDVRTD